MRSLGSLVRRLRRQRHKADPHAQLGAGEHATCADIGADQRGPRGTGFRPGGHGPEPELALARAELIKSGQATCQAFRDKPGSVADLVKNAKASGASDDQVETARVIAIAAIHNLCTDQAGDL